MLLTNSLNYRQTTPLPFWKKSLKAGPGTGRIRFDSISLCQADHYLWEIGNEGQDPFGHDREFRHDILCKYPHEFAMAIAKDYKAHYQRQSKSDITHGRFAANRRLIEIDQELSAVSFKIACDDDDLVEIAKNEADKILRIYAGLLAKNTPLKKIAAELGIWVRNYGLEPPSTKTPKSSIQRMICQLWWRRNLRKKHAQALEAVALKLNLINRKDGVYVSDVNLYRFRSQQIRTFNLKSTLYAVNELGDRLSIQELSDTSVSNPVNRRNELMTRIDGCEKIANEMGFAADMHTVTCPSRMHSALFYNQEHNPKYDGTTPKQAQAYLQKQWGKFRSALDRRDIKYFCIRVAEPQHDATPHWHILLFVAPDNRNTVRSLFKKYALEVDGDEAGALKHRYRFEAIKQGVNPNTGRPYSAAGYIAKYISKNIDGAGLSDTDEEIETDPKAERVRAWASTWGIRQFQFVGCPPVGVYRELRRLRSPIASSTSLEAARQAADQGDWAAYIRSQGGISTKKKHLKIQLDKVWSDQPGHYGDPIGFTTLGVKDESNITVRTRIHEWRIEARKISIPQNDEQYLSVISSQHSTKLASTAKHTQSPQPHRLN